MTELGRNPARIIPEVRSFTDKHPGQRVRYVGEPIWPGRTGSGDLRGDPARGPAQPGVRAGRGDYFVPIRCLGAGGFRPGQRALHAPGAGRVRGDRRDLAGQPAPGMRPPARTAARGARRRFAYETDLAPVRRLVERYARRAGLGEERTVDLVLAANEVAANTISHTDSGGVIHVWHTGEEIVCQVHDTGRITDPLAGRVRHGPDDRGHGLWLVNQVCDLVELRSGADGTTVRMHMRLAG